MSVPGAQGDFSSHGVRQQPERMVDTPSQDRPNRERGLAQKYANQGQITTLMLRNIPSLYTQDLLLEEIVDCMGSSDSFDFFYLPWDLQNDCNVGYAFVNFRDVTSAERCTRIFTNFMFRKFDSRRTCKVFPAHIQGLENNLRHLMDRAVAEAHSHYPIIMWKGEKLKLGKVIAALEGQRINQPPKSAPGMSFAEAFNREVQGSAPSVHVWPPPHQDVSFRSPPASSSGLGHMEADMLQAMPELRAVLNQKRRQVAPVQAPRVMMPASMSGRLSDSSHQCLGAPPVRPGLAAPALGLAAPALGLAVPAPGLVTPPVGITATAPTFAAAPAPGLAAPTQIPVQETPLVVAPVGSMCEIGVRDPDMDVLAKFCKKFSS